MSARYGGTTRGRRLNARVVREEPDCRLRLPGCTGLSTTADHIVPVSLGGERYDRANLRGACAHCNYSRGNGTRTRQTVDLGGSRAW
jgi:5-methylcytosine-specific restriction endonuclease McrA